MSTAVATMFFLLMATCGGNAAVARFLEKDKSKIYNTKFLAHVSSFTICIIVYCLTSINVSNFVLMVLLVHADISFLIIFFHSLLRSVMSGSSCLMSVF